MTTEIFRNMLYGTPIGEVGTSLAGVEVVVLDECHYMNDRQRGTVLGRINYLLPQRNSTGGSFRHNCQRRATH